MRHVLFSLTVLMVINLGIINAQNDRSELIPFSSVDQPLGEMTQSERPSPSPCGLTTKHAYPVGNQAEKLEESKARLKKISQKAANQTEQKAAGTVYTIPVVFHILELPGTTSTDTEYVPDSQIHDALDILNDDFRKLNNQGGIPSNFLNIADDAEIEFELAKVDPDGNCMPNPGIDRLESPYDTYWSFYYTNDGYYYHNTIGSELNWPQGQYLNIHIVNYLQGDISGIAHYPSTAETYPQYDAVIVSNGYLGLKPANNPGTDYYPSTISHEVGHYLGLVHVWGETNTCSDDDGITDTPQTLMNHNYNYPSNCNTSNNSCGTSSGDNLHNFMDYSCQRMFTEGQVASMRGVLEDPGNIANRRTMVENASSVLTCGSSNGCISVSNSNTYTENFDSFPLCSTAGGASNCGKVCNLTNDWINVTNQSDPDYNVPDYIDWRTDKGGTPSSATGPSKDYNTNSANGHYLYTEASGCKYKRADLISPCFDVSNVTNPQMSFRYHMYGSSMGSLYVNVSSDGGNSWQNTGFYKGGNQGNSWKQAVINLPSTNNVVVKIFAITGSSYRSDIAIDYVQVGQAGSFKTGGKEVVATTEDLFEAGQLHVYPNPTQAVVNITIEGELNTSAILGLYDIQGKLIEEQNVESDQLQLDLGAYPKGIYFVRVTDGEHVYQEKIVKLSE